MADGEFRHDLKRLSIFVEHVYDPSIYPSEHPSRWITQEGEEHRKGYGACQAALSVNNFYSGRGRNNTRKLRVIDRPLGDVIELLAAALSTNTEDDPKRQNKQSELKGQPVVR